MENIQKIFREIDLFGFTGFFAWTFFLIFWPVVELINCLTQKYDLDINVGNRLSIVLYYLLLLLYYEF